MFASILLRMWKGHDVKAAWLSSLPLKSRSSFCSPQLLQRMFATYIVVMQARRDIERLSSSFIVYTVNSAMVINRSYSEFLIDNVWHFNAIGTRGHMTCKLCAKLFRFAFVGFSLLLVASLGIATLFFC